MASPSEADLDFLVAKNALLSAYSTAIALALVLYDHLLTLNLEYELVWKSIKKWSLGRVLFLVLRYGMYPILLFPLVGQVIPYPLRELCTAWGHFQFIVGSFLFTCTQAILQLRLYAMYGASKRLLVSLLVFFVLSLGATVILTGIILHNQHDLPLPKSASAWCTPDQQWKFWYVYWVPTMAYETLLFSLALYKGYQVLRSNFVVTGQGEQILDKLVLDSVLYFATIFAAYMTVVIMWITSPFLAQVPVALVMAITSIMAQRLVLNVRQACQDHTATTGGFGTLSFTDGMSRGPVPLSNVSSFWSE